MKKYLRMTEIFSGKFFVKISKNQVSETITHAIPVSILDRFQVQSKAHTHYFSDIIANSQFDVGRF